MGPARVSKLHSPIDYRDNEDKKVLVDEAALMKALDILDELQPGIAQEDWYHELSTAIDEHFKKYVTRRH